MRKNRSLLMAAIALSLVAPQARADELDALIQQVEKGNKSGKSTDEMARDQLVSITTGPVDRRRSAMYESRIYVDNQPIIKTLISTLKSEPALASMAAITLGKMQVKDGVAPLTEALASPSVYVRESAAYALSLNGDPSTIPALEKARPEQPGLTRWIFDDAINTLKKGPPMPSARPASTTGAGVYFLGSSNNTDKLRDQWKPVIERFNLRVWSVPGSDLNPQMGFYGGPLRHHEFSSLLADKDGKPQIDVAFVCNMGPDEFPFELQWQLFNFIRRGGSVVMLGDSMFSSGTLMQPDGKVRRSWGYIPELWHTALPKTLDKEFRPFRAGMHEPTNLTTGVTEFGNGRVVMLRGTGNHQINLRGWDGAFLSTTNYENLIRYAVEGDAGFPALIDLRSATNAAESGKPLSYSAALFSALDQSTGPGEFVAELRRGSEVVSTKSIPVDFAAKNLASVNLQIPTDWQLPSGDYDAVVTFRRGKVSSNLNTAVVLKSPLALSWSVQSTIETAGGELRGSAVIDSKLAQPVENAEAIFELVDASGRALQRTTKKLTIKPGKSEAIPLVLNARDYRVDSYYAVFRIDVEGKTVERSTQLVFRTKPFNFEQDLIMGPFGGLDPGAADPRNKEVMVAAGFNAVGSRFGTHRPGWYNWSYDVAPKIFAKPVWPGDLIEQSPGASLGLNMRLTEPGWNVIDHWDEGSVKVLENDSGVEISGADVFYRNWLKAKYRTLDKLNAAWAADFKAAIAKDPKDPKSKPEPWEENLTSWNQIQLHGGGASDWKDADENLWWKTLDEERKEFRRTNRGHQWWHWSEVLHSRIVTTETPGTLSWQQHEERGALGNFPSSIMLHVIQPNKSLDMYRRFPWAGLVGGARHFSVWSVGLAQTGTFGFNAGWTILNADYTVKEWWKPAAASLKVARSRDQVLLDAWSALSPEVAFFYCDASGNRPVSSRAFFDALHFAGILPDSIVSGTLRSERLDLSKFKVIFRIGKGELPPLWRDKMGAWQKAGGVLLDPPTVNIPRYGGREVEVEKGVKVWVASDVDRITSTQFSDYQSKVLALLAEHGVRPPVQVLDDTGMPAPTVEPALLETHDRTQNYLLAVGDSDIQGAQAFGSLDTRAFKEKFDLSADLYEGAKFKTAGGAAAKSYRIWMLTSADKPFETRFTVDGKLGVPFRDYERLDWLRTERGAGKQRWIAGPGVKLSEGEHTLKLEHRDAVKNVTRVLVVDEPVFEPIIKADVIGKNTVKAVYDVYNDRMLERVGDPKAGLYRAPMRQSDGHLYSLVTEDLAPIKLTARLEQGPSDSVLRVRVEMTKKDGTPSECRHSVMIEAVDASGKIVSGVIAKTSVLGWRVASMFPAVDDKPLTWKIRIKDLTTGATAETSVAAMEANTNWALSEPLTPIELKAGVVDPMPLEGQIHLVPVRATLVNNSDKPIEGKLKLEVPAEFLLEGGVEQAVRVEAGQLAVMVVAAGL